MPLASRSLLLDITLAGERIVVAGERGISCTPTITADLAAGKVPTTQMLTGVHFADAQRAGQ